MLSAIVTKTYTAILGFFVALSAISHHFIQAPSDVTLSHPMSSLILHKDKDTEQRDGSSDDAHTSVVEPTPTTATTLQTTSTTSNDVAPYITSTQVAKEVTAIDTVGDAEVTASTQPRTKPCSEAIPYKLGTFDGRFEISKGDFLRITKDSSSMWGTIFGKPLFVYDEHANLTVNLIYDGRQSTTKNNQLLGGEIENTKQAAAKLQDEYEKDKLGYTSASTQFSNDVDAYNQHYKSYDERVISTNQRGGATQEEFTQMTKEKNILADEAKRLDQVHQTLITSVDSINAKIKRRNELVSYVNQLIRESNATGAKKFTEGRYNPNTNTIDIYQYTDITKLRRVLAHEFGHALGLNHTKDPGSIMYYINKGTSTSLFPDDVQALKDLCN
jgi:hypothetical protein